MAITTTATVKATYSLNTQTAKNLHWLARSWGVAKSSALRRIIDERIKQERSATSFPASPKIEALQWLRQNGLGATKASAWRSEVATERVASDQKSSERWKRSTSTQIS